MVDFEPVNEIPEVKRNFVPSSEAQEIKGIMQGMKVGDIIRIPTEPTNEARNSIMSKSMTAQKHCPEGQFKLYFRGFNVFIHRID